MSESTFRLICACALWAWVLYSLLSGRLVMRGVYTRADRPLAYWAGLAFLVGMGVFLVLVPMNVRHP